MNAEGNLAWPLGLEGKPDRPVRSRSIGTPAKPGDADRIMGFGRDPGDHGRGNFSKRTRENLAEGDMVHLDL